MTRSRSKMGRFTDNIRRNVLSYKYIRHNIFMTALVVVIALCIFAIISFGEKADPLADELYVNESLTVDKSEPVLIEDSSVKLAMESAAPADSFMSANETERVAKSAYSNITAPEKKEESTEVLDGVTASVIYDGVDVLSEASSKADVVASVYSGEMFDVVSKGESYVGVVLYDGSIGYINAEYVSVED
ncbi:MAG: SH3 domain-containing protein [Coprococcus sp.]|nr:SH3 domain-containing protein [Coprococcus sp.]